MTDRNVVSCSSPAMVLLVALVAACGTSHPMPEPRLWAKPSLPSIGGSIFDEVKALADFSSFFGEGCGYGQPSDPGHMADFGIGNGRVFALAGYACPLNTLHTMAGPDYQQEAAFYPDTWFDIESGGTPLQVEKAYVLRPRHSGVLVVAERAGELEWHSVTFAPRTGTEVAERAVIRIVEVHNGRDTHSGQLAMVTHQAEADRDDRMRTLVCIEPADCRDPARIVMDSIPPGRWRRMVVAYVTCRQNDDCKKSREYLLRKDIVDILRSTMESWNQQLQQAARLESPDVRVNDLFDSVLVTVLAQRTWLGGISPMSRYSLMWIRDTAGTVRFLVRAGMYQQARQMIEYYHRAASARGDIGNAVDLDVDVQPPEPDWKSLEPFSGRQAAEGPSYIPLMVHWYARASGDPALVERFYSMLRRCLFAQQIDEKNLLPFSGDETFRAALSISLGLPIEHDFPACCRSANSSFLFAAAAEALAGYAERLGKQQDAAQLRKMAGDVREAADVTYLRPDGSYASFIDLARPGYLPPPFEDVVTKPLWTGYLSPTSEQARANLLAAVELLGTEDGFLQSPLDPSYIGYMNLDITEGVHTGMAPGYYLYNLAATDHPLTETAFNALALAASPSGNFSEYHVYDDHSVLQPLYDSSGTLGDLTARYRHWEGSIDADAMLYALTGLECEGDVPAARLAPRLVNDWPWMRWHALRCGPVRFDLVVERKGNTISIEIESSGPLEVRLSVPLGSGRPESVTLSGRTLGKDEYDLRQWLGQYRVSFPPAAIDAGEPLGATVSASAE